MSSLWSKGGVHSSNVIRKAGSNFSTPWKLTGQNSAIFLLIIFVPRRDRGLVWPLLHVQGPSETLVTSLPCFMKKVSWNSLMRRVNTLEARSSWSTCTPQFQGHYATQSVGDKKVLAKYHGKQRKKVIWWKILTEKVPSKYTRDSLPIFYVVPQHNPLIVKAHMTKKNDYWISTGWAWESVFLFLSKFRILVTRKRRLCENTKSFCLKKRLKVTMLWGKTNWHHHV